MGQICRLHNSNVVIFFDLFDYASFVHICELSTVVYAQYLRKLSLYQI